MAAMSYDDVPVLTEFAQDNDIGYVLLSDKGSKHVDRWGIRNEDYGEGHFAAGVAHPGVFFVDTDGVIALKRAVEGYSDRPSLRELRKAVRALREAGDADQ